ncbi:hypothetical protein PFISCL1PPCAC_5372 [Pristionchus fissidentatus]|uniref:Uncharacterized protein n=1 Tax=Pristionchus fissidentatus TaxID=1538716 RepID=A0AAV5V3B3_9BILA|nr:hypothetical protein PFISCL1PPCAC_5372 [Pristionchus fissidentatus]
MSPYAPNDPSYQHCGCCCRMHVTTAAKSFTVFNVIFMGVNCLSDIKVGHPFVVTFRLAAMALTIYAVFWEKRKPLIVFIVYYAIVAGVSIFACVFLAFSFLIAGGNVQRINKGLKDKDMDAEKVIGLVFQVIVYSIVICYYTKILLNFRRYLEERDQVDQPPVVFEARTEEKETDAPPPYDGISKA